MKNKKSQSMFLMFLPIALIIGGAYWYTEIKLPQLEEEAIQRGEVCDEFTSVSFMKNGYGCCKDCEELNLQYFKYEFSSSLFGANVENCYCENNNTITQVW